MRIIEATRSVSTGMPVWPGDPPFRCGWSARLPDDGVNAAELSLGTHTGTHVDAPLHVMLGGAPIGYLPLAPFIGPAHVIATHGAVELGEAWLTEHLPDGCERLLLRTRAWREPRLFPDSWPALTADGAQLLVARGVRLVGTDAPSPDPVDSKDLPVHRILLGAEIPIIENLQLVSTKHGHVYELIALPLFLLEADASPVRAVLVER